MKVLVCLFVLSMVAYSQGLKCYVCGLARGTDGNIYVVENDECRDNYYSKSTECVNNHAECSKSTHYGFVGRGCATGCELMNEQAPTTCCASDGCNSASALQITSAIIIPVFTMLYFLK